MDQRIYSSLPEALTALFGPGSLVRGERDVAGGCINQAGVLSLETGRRVFIKRNRRESLALFQGEAAGLEALAAVSEGPRTPRALALGQEGPFAFLLLEHLEEAPRRADFWETFGRELAALHRRGRRDACGFHRDNHIGATPQPNGDASSWVDFFRTSRLEFQLRLAREAGLIDGTLLRRASRLSDRLEELLIEPDQGRPSLLHGDLWSGNFLGGPEGKACLIDPAVSYGHREADLAMTELFGGFAPAFYGAYREAWPLEPGYGERRDLYNLYHLLNHLNLFGRSYLGGVEAVLGRYV